MNELLPYYHKVDPTTWAYVSSLLMIGLYFKFSRFWSVRNLDLLLLILLAPGLLMVNSGYAQRKSKPIASAVDVTTPIEATNPLTSPLPPEVSKPAVAPPEAETKAQPTASEKSSRMHSPMDELLGEPLEEIDHQPTAAERGMQLERFGYLWLFVTGGLLLVRLLVDSTMVRRPLLEPNLSPGGLAFIGGSLFVFLMGNMIASPAEALTPRPRNSPGYALVQSLPPVPSGGAVLVDPDVPPPPSALSKVLVTLAQLAIVIAVIGIGYRHFDNLKMGVGAASLYLMLPYTSQMAGMPEHAIPAAFLLWAVLFYRRPLTAGLFMGLAAAVGYYPLFLLPLWLSFYWQRGLMRFITGVLTTLFVAAVLLVCASNSSSDFALHVRAMFGLLAFRWRAEDLGGIWALGWDPVYRVPMLTAFIALSGSFALWPAQKNLGTLLSCSAAVMLAAQFWHGNGGGLYMAWYLPLLLLTVFRPNLEDRVALSVLGEGWFPRRRWAAGTMERAA
ncbi:MAG TPA: hypothetical protein VL096_11210 [Pirellulaceae bacterium]|nr:hypothetical protein [Pirellulaceae bacterium]